MNRFIFAGLIFGASASAGVVQAEELGGLIRDEATFLAIAGKHARPVAPGVYELSKGGRTTRFAFGIEGAQHDLAIAREALDAELVRPKSRPDDHAASSRIVEFTRSRIGALERITRAAKECGVTEPDVPDLHCAQNGSNCNMTWSLETYARSETTAGNAWSDASASGTGQSGTVSTSALADSPNGGLDFDFDSSPLSSGSAMSSSSAGSGPDFCSSASSDAYFDPTSDPACYRHIHSNDPGVCQ